MTMNCTKLHGFVYVKKPFLADKCRTYNMNDNPKNNILMSGNSDKKDICQIFSNIKMLFFVLLFILHTLNLLNWCLENTTKTGHNTKWVVADLYYLQIIRLKLFRNSWANLQIHFLLITHIQFSGNEREQHILKRFIYASFCHNFYQWNFQLNKKIQENYQERYACSKFILEHGSNKKIYFKKFNSVQQIFIHLFKFFLKSYCFFLHSVTVSLGKLEKLETENFTWQKIKGKYSKWVVNTDLWWIHFSN